ncbi:MAG: ABC transporter substrate-binding protein, partial [Romboutsia sp.]
MRRNRYIALILAILFLAVGCKSEQETTVKKEEAPSAISLDYINLTIVKPKTINPLLNKDKSVGYITNLIYDGLFTINENYDVVPQLAEEFGISQDGSSINIK